MADAGDGESFRSPLGVTTDETGNSIVRVCLVIPGIKKQLLKKAISNGNVDVQFLQRSIDVKVKLDSKEGGTNKTDNFRYHVNRLPKEIIPEKSQVKVEKDKIVLLLHKAEPSSWAADLDNNGLETDERD